MDAKEFKRRTMDFSCAMIDLVEAMPPKPTSAVLVKQLLRSATSVAANYRAACRAKSPSDFIYKLGIVEADEITAMIVASINTARLRKGSRG